MLAEPPELVTPTGTTVERVPNRPAPPTVSLQKDDPTGVAPFPYVAGYPGQPGHSGQAGYPGGLPPTATPPGGLPPGPPPTGTPPYGPVPPGSQPPRRSSGRAWAVAAVVAVLVAAAAVVAVVLVSTGSPDRDSTTAASSVQAVPPTAAGSAETRAVAPPRQSKAYVQTSEGAGTGSNGPASSAGPATTAAAVAPTRQDIGCDEGYIVQVASELDRPAFDRRITDLRTAGQLPAGVKWAETSSSCKIFTAQVNVLVLYAGPFASPADACPARLLSPADAFIKSTTPDVTTVISCVCPADPNSLPKITTVGQRDVWVGELQRVLGAKLDYDVGEINADPAAGDAGRWGIYTDETAAAVGRFQADSNLPQSRQVDAATWSALRAQGC
ncbi:peptidoglycan-binding domain-containing protein [Nakamurella sp. GG22]